MRTANPEEIERVGSIQKAIAGYAGDIRACESDHQVSDQVLQFLAEQGVFDLYRPETASGWIAPPSLVFRIVVQLAALAPSVAWAVMVHIKHNLMLTRYPERLQSLVFEARSMRLAVAAIPAGRAVRARDGVTLSGSWPLVPVACIADWFVMEARAEGGDKLQCFVPADELVIDPAENLPGLSVSGFGAVSADNVFVPNSRIYDPQVNPVAREPADLSADWFHASVVIAASTAVSCGAFQGLLQEFGQRAGAAADRERKLDLCYRYQDYSQKFDFIAAAVSGSMAAYDFSAGYPIDGVSAQDRRYLTSRQIRAVSDLLSLSAQLQAEFGGHALTTNPYLQRLAGAIAQIASHELISTHEVTRRHAELMFFSSRSRERGDNE